MYIEDEAVEEEDPFADDDDDEGDDEEEAKVNFKDELPGHSHLDAEPDLALLQMRMQELINVMRCSSPILNTVDPW